MCSIVVPICLWMLTNPFWISCILLLFSRTRGSGDTHSSPLENVQQWRANDLSYTRAAALSTPLRQLLNRAVELCYAEISIPVHKQRARGSRNLPLVMRARIFLCITLLYLCHPQLWPQAVTKQFPPSTEEQHAREDSLPDDPSSSTEIPVAKVVPAPPTGVPVEIHADTQREQDNVYTLSGNVIIYYSDYVVQADKVTYNRETSEVVAEGHLIVDGGRDNEHITATHGEMNLDQDTAHFYDVVGTLGVASQSHNRMVFNSPNPFALTGREVFKLGEGRYRLIDGTMTSCRLPKPDWRLMSKQINLADGKASARNTWFQLFGIPLLYLPYATHPVDEETRSSGILLPIIGNSTTKGLILGEEVYFALSRNSDLTVGAEYFSKRGYSPMGLFRYRGFGEDFLNVRFHALLDRLPEPQNQGGVDLLVDGRRDWGQHTRAVIDADVYVS